MLKALWAIPWVKKAAIYSVLGIVVSGGIFLSLRWYGNVQWRAGEQAGRVAATTELEDQYRERWRQTGKDIAAAAVQTAQDRSKLEAQASSLARSRQSLQTSLDSTLQQINQAREANDATVHLIPGDELDAALRDLSAELAAAK